MSDQTYIVAQSVVDKIYPSNTGKITQRPKLLEF